MTVTSVVRPLPGAGLVARSGDLMLVCAEGTDATRAEVEQLLRLVPEVATAGGDGAVLVRRVAALLAADLDGQFPDCAACGPVADGRMAVLVYGSATARVVGAEGEVRLSAVDAVASVNRLVPGPITSVRLELPGAGPASHFARLDGGVVSAAGFVAGEEASSGAAADFPVPLPAPAPEATPWWGSTSAANADPVPAELMTPADDPAPAAVDGSPAGVAWAPAVPEPAPADPVPAFTEPAPAWSAPTPPDAAGWLAPSPATPLPTVPSPDDGGFAVSEPQETPGWAAPSVVDASIVPAEVAAPVPTVDTETPPLPLREPLATEPIGVDARPTVLGLACPLGHLNDPSLSVCVVCGSPLPTQPPTLREGPRPALGLITLDDGSQYVLDIGYVLGREPQHDPEVVAGGARPLKIVDADGVVSRRHLRVALVGWDVQIVDLGSANGTFVQYPDDQQLHRLEPHHAVVVKIGTTVTMGRRSFRLDPVPPEQRG